MNILYHGRFQPPHIGHINLIKYFNRKYPGSFFTISIDVRPPDKENPFSFYFRQQKFEKLLNNSDVNFSILGHYPEPPRHKYDVIVVFKEKHGDRQFVVPTREALEKVALKIVLERDEEGWYEFPQFPTQPDISVEQAEKMSNGKRKHHKGWKILREL
jgi:nicotinamide mononucleotide adenylyltransferase